MAALHSSTSRGPKMSGRSAGTERVYKKVVCEQSGKLFETKIVTFRSIQSNQSNQFLRLYLLPVGRPSVLGCV